MSERTNLSQVQWRWHLARRLAAVGRPGWLGLGALAVAILAAATVLPPAVQQLNRLQEDADKEREKRLASGFNPEAPLPRMLGGQSSAPEFVQSMTTLAQREGIKIERIDYQLLRDPGKPVLQYRADLTAQAPYLRLRTWIDAVLRERQSVALDELVFERANVDAAETTARVRFTLFMRGEG